MNIEDFRKLVMEPLMTYSPTLNRFHTETAYKDLINTYAIIQEYIIRTSRVDIVELAKSGKYKAYKRTTENYNRLFTLLKALFVFADIFASVLLSEAVGKTGLTLNGFLMNPKPPLINLSITQILPAYCTVIYRNKLITHHDVNRLYSAKILADLRGAQLIPLPEKMYIAEKDVEAIMRLKSKYETSISNLAEEINQWELIKMLFYGIPIGALGFINDDRKEINKIAEQGGCESLTPIEVVGAMDQFALAIVSEL